MARKRPILNLTRNGTTATLTFPNWNNEEVFIYRADGQDGQFSFLDSVTANQYVDNTLDADLHYKYYVRMTDLESSVEITEDHSDENPPYYSAQEIGSATLSIVNDTITMSWTADPTIPLIRVSGLAQGLSSIGKYAT